MSTALIVLLTIYAVGVVFVAGICFALPNWRSAPTPFFEALFAGLLWPLAIIAGLYCIIVDGVSDWREGRSE